MKKAVLRSAGTAALGVVFAAAAAGTASAAPALPDPLGGIGLAGASQSLPLAGPLTQTVGALNPATGARVVAQGVHTVEPTLSGVADAADHLASNSGQRQMPVATTRAMGPGGVNLTPTSHGNSFGGPLGQVLGLLGTGSLLG